MPSFVLLWALMVPVAGADGAAIPPGEVRLAGYETPDTCQEHRETMLHRMTLVVDALADRARSAMDLTIGGDGLEADVPAFLETDADTQALAAAQAWLDRLRASRCVVSGTGR